MKAKKLVALIMSAAMVVGSASIFAACKKDEEPGNEPGNNPGEIVNPGTPENPGTDTPTFINDTYTYYAVGAGSGTLSTQNWNAASDEIAFDKDTTVEDANIFTLTLKMYAGDQFKVLFDTVAGWSGTSINYYSLTDAAKTYFETNNDSNIICKEGQDGVYTFTLTTDLTKTDWAEQYVLTVSQDEAIAPLPVPYKMQIAGGLTVNMTSNGEGVWSADIEVKKAHLYLDEDGNEVESGGEYAAIYIFNAGNVYTENATFYDAEYKYAENVMIGGTAYDVNLLDIGQYTVTFTEGEDGAGTVVIEKVTALWHIVLDDVVDETDTGLNLNFGNGVWVSSTLILTDETKVQLKNLDDDSAALIEVGTLDAGQWGILYNPETGEVKYGRDGYYVVGTYTNPEWGSGLEGGVAVMLEFADEGDDYIHYSAEIELKAGQTVKIAYGVPYSMAQGSYKWYGSDTNISADGTYVIEMWSNNKDGFVVNLKADNSGSESEGEGEVGGEVGGEDVAE